MLELILSDAAQADFYEIAAFGSERYGPLAAADYVESFGETFDLLCRIPEAGRARDGLMPGIRSRRHESHIVYYVVQVNAIFIARVMHAAADVTATRFV